jgi:transposase, IS30 family
MTAVIESINDRMLPIAAIVLTITLDNGREFSMHEMLSLILDACIFFAKPYHSWERELNENTNGLVRQYYPKKTSFDNIRKSDLMNTERKLNNRPRKCLNYKTPHEVLSRLCERRGIALGT